ncbi:cell division protein ZipA C-terminal FtsZ-binding domain-containing protein [Cupriavidus gilardii]|uniref:cell division protein ZipA C-terminal FtsZ-binding domain-containing protein n=1 Tax=Cupriavidus gilardii TaxID=82541 RepID=UPI001580B0C1|nr:cell division protein ZipA C-terminal FtsZ-binding domain-containing protein [Cupriavidus gilardii]MCT9073682.1 cell division protein FtsZ [Cupriavidus gilardii]QKS63480.1 cell division protein FtsZ [Cupriavidus gilardii]
MDLQTALVVAGIVLLLLVVAYNQWQIRKSRRPRALQPEDDLPPMREPVVGEEIKPEVSAKLHEPPRPETIQRKEPKLSVPPLDDDAQAAQAASPLMAGSADADELLAEEVADGVARSAPSVRTPGAPPAPHAGQDTPADAGEAPKAARAEPSATAAAPAAAPQPEPVAEPIVADGQPRPAVIDPLIDCIVPLHLERKASGDRILPLTGRLRRAGTKQVHIEGLYEPANAWEPVTAGHQYEDLQVAVQLANRGGPLNALEFSEFVNAVEALAESLDASAELPDMSETVANARELDGFAAACDVQLGVNVVSDGAPWSAAYVQNVATQDGLVLSRDGTRFTRYQAGPDGIQRALFTLQFGDTNFLRDDLTVKAGSQITLLLDVPQASQAVKPLKTMCEYGDSLAQRMGARLVDDNHRPLTETSFVAIFQQLQALYDKLEARGMPAGSPVALRLFSS